MVLTSYIVHLNCWIRNKILASLSLPIQHFGIEKGPQINKFLVFNCMTIIIINLQHCAYTFCLHRHVLQGRKLCSIINPICQGSRTLTPVCDKYCFKFWAAVFTFAQLSYSRWNFFFLSIVQVKQILWYVGLIVWHVFSQALQNHRQWTVMLSQKFPWLSSHVYLPGTDIFYFQFDTEEGRGIGTVANSALCARASWSVLCSAVRHSYTL